MMNLNIYVLNMGGNNYIKQIVLDIEGQISPGAIIVGNVNTIFVNR
jgi:hypothetical protein